ncbi:MAG: hypothetical protein ACLT4C_02555 [Butyricicoccus sp.]
MRFHNATIQNLATLTSATPTGTRQGQRCRSDGMTVIIVKSVSAARMATLTYTMESRFGAE